MFETGILVILIILLRRAKDQIRSFLKYTSDERLRIDRAVRILVDLLTDIVNASALSGESVHMLAKRLNRILTSARGEGRTIKDEFMVLADLYEGGLLTWLQMHHPSLTRNEVGLCGLITLDLYPASIDRIFGYDHGQTVYNKRGEIRKKLQLDRAVPLERFLKEKSEQLRQEQRDFLRPYENMP